MSSVNNNPNSSALAKLGLPLTPFEILTNALSLADLVYKVARILFEEKVQIIEPQRESTKTLNVGEAGSLFLKIKFQNARINLRIIFSLKHKKMRRKSGVRIELAGETIYPPPINS